LNEACREAFCSILDKFDSQKREIASLKTQLSGLSGQLFDVVRLIKDGRHHPLQPVEAEWPQHPEEDDGDDGDDDDGKLWLIVVCFFAIFGSPFVSDGLTTQNDDDNADDAEEDAANNDPKDGAPPPLPPLPGPRRLTANDLGQGRMPAYPTRIPRTFLQFLATWEANGLSEFLGDPMKSPGWQGRQGRAKREAWGKRKYIYAKICARAQELLVSIPEAARLLDLARGAETLGNWYKRTHGADQDLARRNRLGLVGPARRDDDKELPDRPAGVLAPAQARPAPTGSSTSSSGAYCCTGPDKPCCRSSNSRSHRSYCSSWSRQRQRLGSWKGEGERPISCR
jgi:hypothetical protein